MIVNFRVALERTRGLAWPEAPRNFAGEMAPLFLVEAAALDARGLVDCERELCV